jgi:CHAT domain-containing protein
MPPPRAAAVGVLVALSLSGCNRPPPAHVVLEAQCAPLSGERPRTIPLDIPADGQYRIVLTTRGVSAVLQAGDQRSASPVDRFGASSLIRDARAGEHVVVEVRSHDSPQVAGESCVTVARLPAANEKLLRAEQAFATAGQEVSAGNSKAAFESYLAAARAFDSFDRVRAAQARHAMGELAYEKLGREVDAFQLARLALADFGAAATPGHRSSLVSLQARTMLEAREPASRARVFALLDEAERLARRDALGARELPRIEILRGFMEYRGDNPANATPFFNRAANECEALKDWECYARALQNIAARAEEQRDFAVALKAYADALRALPPELDPELTAYIWSNQGRLQGVAGLVEQSQQSHRTAIQLHAGTRDCEGVRMGAARLGSLLVQVGSVADGASVLARASSLECGALVSVAAKGIDTEEGPSVGACTNLPRADSLGAAGKLAVFNALMGLREAFRLDGRNREANRCLTAAREFASTPRTALRLANAMGEAWLDQHEPARAIAAFKEANAQADASGVPLTNASRSATFLGLARAALQAGQPEVAREHAMQTLTLGSARAHMSQVVTSLQLIARSFSDAGEDSEAISVLSTAAALADQVPIADLDPDERATWLGTQHAIFDELTALHANRASTNEDDKWRAFEAAERGRARSLRFALSQAAAEEDKVIGEPSDRYRDLMQRIAALARRTDADEPASGFSIEPLAQLVRSTTSSDEGTMRPALQGVLARLNATAIEFAIARDDIYAFVVDSERLSLTRLGSRAEIGSATEALYERLKNPESAPADVRRAAARLAQLVLWPITKDIHHERVLLIPEDSLHTVPFAILPWAAGEDAPLFVERAELAVTPSTLFVTHARAVPGRRRSTPHFELIGDPIFRHTEWRRECEEGTTTLAAAGTSGSDKDTTRGMSRSLPRLPGSRREVLAIAAQAQESAPSGRVRIHLGCQATPAALRSAAASSPDLLHIATHGYVDAFRPRLSALALTPESAAVGGASTIGLLDILNMRVDARLVVLSACDTSRGRLLPGEGVLGPAQAFLQSGAASVVASYWRIPDERTAPFMETFYRYLLADGLSAAAALRRAQLDFVRDNVSHDWAAFTLYGWPDTSLRSGPSPDAAAMR